MRFTVFILFFASITLSRAQNNLQTFQEQALFENGQWGYACFRIPAIVTAPNGELLAFAEGRKKNCWDFGDVDLVLRRSKDNGLSWSLLELVIDYDTLQAGNPAPVFDLTDPKYPNGRLFLLYNSGNNHEGEVRKGRGVREVWYVTSTDNGKTWSSPTNITLSVHKPLQTEFNTTYNFPEDWRSYALTPGHAIQLQQEPYTGRLFIPANHSEGDPLDGFDEYRAHAFYTDDHGKTWELSESVSVESSNESIAVELPDGTIMQNIRHQSGRKKQRLIALSKDGGASWDTTYFDAQLPSPVCQASIMAYKNPNDEVALLFSNPNSTERREKMTIKVSFDNGETWPISRPIRAGASAYSDLATLQNKQIGLLYERGNDGGIHFATFSWAWLVGDQ
ncbi:MAG: sialidase family protein [Bacteroidota bacterium]